MWKSALEGIEIMTYGIAGGRNCFEYVFMCKGVGGCDSVPIFLILFALPSAMPWPYHTQSLVGRKKLSEADKKIEDMLVDGIMAPERQYEGKRD